MQASNRDAAGTAKTTTDRCPDCDDPGCRREEAHAAWVRVKNVHVEGDALVDGKPKSQWLRDWLNAQGRCRQHETGRCWVCRKSHGVRPGRLGYVVRCGGCEDECKTSMDVERHEQLVTALGRRPR